MPSNPISPDEVVASKQIQLPDVVIECFNELIAKYWNGRESTFNLDEAANLIADRVDVSLIADFLSDHNVTVDLKRQAVFQNRWLDVEYVYRANGWKVEYDRPGYNETYPSTFRFTKP